MIHWFSKIAFLTLAYLVAYGQASWRFPHSVLGAQPDLLPGMLVYSALSHPPGVVIGMAVVLGLLGDGLSLNPIGTSSMVFLLISFGLLRHRELLLKDQLAAQVVFGTAASALSPLMALWILWVSGREPLVGWHTVWQTGIVAAVGGVVTPIWFWLLGSLEQSLRWEEVGEYSPRGDRQIDRGWH